MTSVSSELGYGGTQACKIVGITYRQLDYWARTGLLEPTIAEADGSGTRRKYSFRDLVHLKVIKNLLDAGVNLPQIRKAVDFLISELKLPMDEVTLVSDGSSVYAATSDAEYVDLLRRGQGVIAIAIGPVAAKLKGSVESLGLLPQGPTAAAEA